MSQPKASTTMTPRGSGDAGAINRPSSSRPSPSRNPRSQLTKTVSTATEKKELCGYMHRICLQNRLEGFEYCIRHILADKNAPFRQCSYVHPHSNRKCPNAARKTATKDNASTLCPWHIKKICLKRKTSDKILQKAKQTALHRQSYTGLLKSLEHYCPEDHDKKRKGGFWSKQEDGVVVATDDLRQRINEAAAMIAANDSDDDPSVDQTMRSDLMDSDSESIDSDQEDPLKHAGVYTAEEVSLILSDKMHRLQKLYIEQFKLLKFLLREKYRKYCSNALTDREGLIPESPTPEEAEVLMALKKYHRYKGKEDLLKRQARERRRALTEGSSYRPVQPPICIFDKNGEKCTNRSLPCTFYCSKHVMFDHNQVLFRPCAEGNPPCLTPVIAFQHKNACLAHKYLKTDTSTVKKVTGQEEKDDVNNICPMATAEPELFQSIDDISSLAMDNIGASALFSLDQFGDLGSSDLLQ